jgi:hypothetical protein
MMEKESWSRKYYSGLTDQQHDANDQWFWNALAMLTDSGILVVPNLQMTFNKQGQPIGPPLGEGGN